MPIGWSSQHGKRKAALLSIIEPRLRTITGIAHGGPIRPRGPGPSERYRGTFARSSSNQFTTTFTWGRRLRWRSCGSTSTTIRTWPRTSAARCSNTRTSWSALCGSGNALSKARASSRPAAPRACPPPCVGGTVPPMTTSGRETPGRGRLIVAYRRQRPRRGCDPAQPPTRVRSKGAISFYQIVGRGCAKAPTTR